MTDDFTITSTYEQRRQCIEVRCTIPLTPEHVIERLEELANGKHPKSKSFATLYGEQHLQQTIAWFRQAADAAPGARQ